jgi:hypothetical protein
MSLSESTIGGPLDFLVIGGGQAGLAFGYYLSYSTFYHSPEPYAGKRVLVVGGGCGTPSGTNTLWRPPPGHQAPLDPVASPGERGPVELAEG